ncbi:uncharacterized protein BDZ99DRAFT_521715 [Mytilinidion resinicola]|uniref:Ankyrin n=1 Tax=Mytilinidion resinicola TaxID=574789 RepID=A0A6A6YH57_9PEZI|nr:uncharacterized protein BDZ99DRAFT_521715 [Mytilinidion resinicola]KAF2808146.1 hypothetical protein BDZ99DRAFT_521715 [Mytilinidion resinicola]
MAASFRSLQTHSNIRVFLQAELHKPAIMDRPGCNHTSSRHNAVCPCKHVPAMKWTIHYDDHRLLEYLLRHQTSGKFENKHWPAVDWVIEYGYCESEFIVVLLQYAQRLGKDRNILKNQMTSLLESHVGGLHAYRVEAHKSTNRARYHWVYVATKADLQVVKLLLQLGADPIGLSTLETKWSQHAIQPSFPVPHVFRVTVPNILKEFIKYGADFS